MSLRRKPNRRVLLIACAAATAVAAALIVALSGGGHSKATAASEARLAANDPMFVAGTSAAFRYLAAQSSNRCELEPRSLLQMANKGRLQGSCCSPMDLAAYQSQVRGLRAYRDIVQIPRDPYDIPVSLAKRLLSYDRTITLSAARRGQGTGAALLHELERRARDAGCRVLDLDSGADREDAHRFYVREQMVIRGFHFLRRLT